VKFLKARLQPVVPANQKVLDKLVDDLNSDKFATREKATKDLENLGDLAKKTLTDRLATNPLLEVKQRIDKLMTKLNGPVQTPQMLQALRGIEVLERIGNPEALATLTAIAAGAPGHRITEDASDSVQRLKKQIKTP
jgi:hypothetical protein